MTEKNYKYSPCSYLEYKNVTTKQFNVLKRRLKNSKKLNGVDIKVAFSGF